MDKSKVSRIQDLFIILDHKLYLEYFGVCVDYSTHVSAVLRVRPLSAKGVGKRIFPETPEGHVKSDQTDGEFLYAESSTFFSSFSYLKLFVSCYILKPK